MQQDGGGEFFPGFFLVDHEGALLGIAEQDAFDSGKMAMVAVVLIEVGMWECFKGGWILGDGGCGKWVGGIEEHFHAVVELGKLVFAADVCNVGIGCETGGVPMVLLQECLK